MKGFYCCLVYTFLLILIFPSIGLAEGTKQILLSDAGHGKIEVMPSFNNFAWYTAAGASAPVDYRLHITIANIGETIYYGFGNPLNNNDQVVNDVNYRIKDPSGNIVVGPTTIPLSGAGHIATFAEAVAGPAAIVGGSGYTALSYTPLLTGDYFIEFNFPNVVHDRTKFKYFDITVATAANTAIDGRIWSMAWQMTADNQAPPSGVYTFFGKLFAYSDDGIVTSINFNGMEPFVFIVSCNPWGCYNTGNFNNDRRSVYGNHTLTQYKIFLNDPDSLVYPTGILGTVVPPIVITPDCNGSASIQIEVTKAGNLDILLNIDPLPGKQPKDVSLTWTATVGTNTIPWNGLNGLGQQVLNGSSFDVIVTYINGLTNLPIYDVEENPNGFIIELKRPVGPIPPVFWDDILVGGTQNFTGCTFVLPSTGCHAFSGNNNTMNSWWYAVTSVSLPVVFTELRKPNIPGTITGPTPLCPGATGNIYWIHPEANSTGYVWSYTGAGATITAVNDTTISIDFANNATSGNITVIGTNAQCGPGPAQTTAITIQVTPVVTLLPYPPVCIDAPAFTLTGGFPVGGTYWVGGVQVTTFDPAAQGVGSHPVTYTYTDPNTTCTASSTQNIVVNPLPVVTFSPLTPVCISFPPFALTGGAPSGGIYSGIGVNGGIFNPSVSGAGTFNIIYTYTDANGCINSATAQITVYPLPSLTFPPLAPVCINAAPFPLSGAIPPGGTYGGVGVVSGVFYPGTAGLGTHLITYVYMNSNGCTDSISQNITVKPLPVPVIAGPAIACVNTPGPQYFTEPGMSGYIWTINGGTFTTGATPDIINVIWTSTGLKNLTVNYTASNGCVAANPTVFYVDVSNLPVPTITTGPDNICIDIQTSYTTQTGMSGYVWTVSPDGSVTGGNTYKIDVTWNTPGTKQVSVNYQMGPGCTGAAPATKSVMVNQPTPPTITSPVNPICMNNGTSYTTQPGMSNYIWNVSPGGTFTSPIAGNIVNVTWNAPGPQYVDVNFTNTDGCIAPVPFLYNVQVNPLPVTTITAGTGPDCELQQHVYQTPPDPVCTFTWSANPGNVVSGQGTNLVTINWLTPGPAIVSVTGTYVTTTGCTSSSTFSTTVYPSPVPSFTPCFDQVTTKNAKPFILKGGLPLLGQYQGSTGITYDAITGKYWFDPSSAAEGIHLITYYSQNSYGCSNTSSPVSITVLPSNVAFSCGTVFTDPRDNKQYPTVQIGTQCWMAANLDYGQQLNASLTQRDNCVVEKYCYNNISANCTSNGGLYQWDELMQYNNIPASQGLCSPGWHVPTEANWNTLFSFYISNGFAGSPLKYTGYSGFNALLTGVRFKNSSWSFNKFAILFWSSSSNSPYKAWAHGMNEQNPSVSYYPGVRSNGFSVRCLKD